MSDTHTDRLGNALAHRYCIERELGQGGMAMMAVRRYGGTAARGFDG